MSKKNIILKAEGVSKQYRLGLVGTGTLSHDLNRWWHKIRGKEDPYLKIGDSNDRSKVSTSDYVWALKDINFEVQRGEVLGIIGKNGAGKSTLLKILSKVTTPTTGEIKTKGRIASLLEVGTGFHPEMTGRENIYLNGAILGMTKAEIKSKEAEIIDFSGCAGYIDTPVKRYSSGMRVRLAFAVAAHLEPDILVVDEVLAVGDAEFQKKAIGKMQDISRGDGRTVLFVSHNMAAVKNLCTRGILLRNGNVIYDGDVNECIEKYLKVEEDTFNFLDFKSRVGKGSLRITDLKITNSNKKIVKYKELKSNEDYYFSITVKNNISQANYFSLGLSIYSDKGQLLTASGSEYIHDNFKIEANDVKQITLYIPSFPFTSGKYILNLSCKSNLSNLEDYIKDSIILQVENVETTIKSVTKFPNQMIKIIHEWQY